VEIEFFGAAGEVTGSCHILRVGRHTVLLDCGMVQGGAGASVRNRTDFPFAVGSIDAVVLSHAHIDHCGRLPLLVKRGYRGPISGPRGARG
jgi:metallo-beta-lactamase family protein